jgi:ABC-type xylose transport system permease subunit
VYQDLALCDNLDVVANLYIGRERARGVGRNLRLLDEIGMQRADAVRLVVIAVGTVVAVAVFNSDRGVPLAVCIFIGFVVTFDILTRRTVFGRPT